MGLFKVLIIWHLAETANDVTRRRGDAKNISCKSQKLDSPIATKENGLPYQYSYVFYIKDWR